MLKSKKCRSVVGALCLFNSACAGGPQLLPHPTPEECPPGGAENNRKFVMFDDVRSDVALNRMEEGQVLMTIREGKVTVGLIGDWGILPDRTLVHGRIFFGRDLRGTARVYGRFTEVTLPSGEKAPICWQMVRNRDIGLPMEPGSAPEEGKARIVSTGGVVPVDRFE